MHIVRYILLAEAFAVTTFGLGWWSVPVVAAIWAVFSTHPRRALYAALCAAGGWATLLLLDAVRGPVGVMAAQLGAVMRIPGPLLLVISLLFPALLAWAAAALVPRRAKSGDNTPSQAFSVQSPA